MSNDDWKERLKMRGMKQRQELVRQVFEDNRPKEKLDQGFASASEQVIQE